MDNSLPYLPQKIIRDILLRLPIKSLVRFQCVCKDWKNLFKTESFIAEHLDRSTEQNSLLFGYYYYAYGICIFSHEMQVEFQKPYFIDELDSSWKIVSSSNGLICLEVHTSRSLLFLWNPATREVCRVPKTLKLSGDKYYPVGFGFSSILKDYKIVRLYASKKYLPIHRVEVYSLSKRSWKKVGIGNLKGVTRICGDGTSYNGISCNGAIFWLAVKRGDRTRYLIVSFDLTMEEFEFIELPTLCDDITLHYHTLTVFEDKLTIFYRRVYENPRSCSIDLWLMEGLSWIKIYTINPFPYSLQPLAIWRGEIICKSSTHYSMERTFMFNLFTNEVMERFPVSMCFITHSVLNYVESLVPIHRKKSRLKSQLLCFV